MRRDFWRIDAAVPVMAASVAWEAWRQGWRVGWWLPSVVAILLHEAAHVAAAKLCGARVRGVRVALTGARLTLEGLLSYGDEWVIAAAGPMANLLSAALVFPVWRMTGGDAFGGAAVFVVSSVVLGLLNLLPVASLDGGRMLYCALAKWKGMELAAAAVRIGGLCCLWALWLVAGYVMLRTGGSLSLWVFATCLLVNGRE